MNDDFEPCYGCECPIDEDSAYGDVDGGDWNAFLCIDCVKKPQFKEYRWPRDWTESRAWPVIRPFNKAARWGMVYLVIAPFLYIVVLPITSLLMVVKGLFRGNGA